MIRNLHGLKQLGLAQGRRAGAGLGIGKTLDQRSEGIGFHALPAQSLVKAIQDEPKLLPFQCFQRRYCLLGRARIPQPFVERDKVADRIRQHLDNRLVVFNPGGGFAGPFAYPYRQ